MRGVYYHKAEDMFKDFEMSDALTDVRVTIDGNKLLIDNILIDEKRQGLGVGRKFLKYLKGQGYEICIGLPVKTALPFWRKMFNEGLIDCNPDKYKEYKKRVWGIQSYD